MWRKRILEAEGPVKQIAHIDGDDLHIQEIEDAEPLLNEARRMTDAGGVANDAMRLEAYIPQTVLNDAFRQGWYHDPKAWKRWANDPANRRFRVEYNGKVNRL